ncbi:glycosyl hydrolase [Pirellula staleyi DSM 6068]|uniref:Glycosyl hydrolase n=1 Tax=Pirellula staleyi (strain ATCC 27377 / DSM 6068 / ICPB 4128) TaxID=530564 RepID=D2R134_PIRSD|nr:ThuA domain-containing protein [Pirellula staleyi]ADB18519.1 glycosyl hydrolase [Pirellula staleyi DSM 6068]
MVLTARNYFAPWVATLAACALVVASIGAASAEDKAAPAGDKPAKGYRILMLTQSAGFKHGSVNRKEGNLSPSEQVVTEMGIRSNLFRVDCSQDAAKDFTKENLQNYDIVFFYTTGNLPIKEEDLNYFFKEWLPTKGHGFIGAHSAADTYHNYEPYWDMIGGTFNGHPWGSGETVTVTVHDKTHPASKPWGDEFEIKDEIYQFKNWQPSKVRVLMSLNMAKTKLKKPYHVPVLWVKNYGEGKAMHMSLGHNESVWTNETYQASLLGGIKWVLNLEEGDATPNPDLSQAQEEKAKADAESSGNK